MVFIFHLTSSVNPFSVYQRCPLATSSKYISTKEARSHYEELGVSENATTVDIKKAFITKSKELHPDINPQDPELHEAFVKISAAYNILGNVENRRQYDLKLNNTHQQYTTSDYTYSTRSPFGTRNHASQYTQENRWHESSQFHHPPVRRTIRKNPYNKYVVIGALLFMMTGAAVHYVVINTRHKKYQAHFEEATRKANLAYIESKERARSNGIHKQLELLMAQHAQPGSNNLIKKSPNSSDEENS